MSDIIDTVQLQDIDDSLLHLFELTIVGSSTTIYAYAGLEAGETSIYFPDRNSPYTAREYSALPMELEGVEMSSDGAQSRPILSVANIVSIARTLNTDETSLRDELETLNIVRNEDIIGSKITLRTTLGKNLVSAGSSGVAPVEFPIQTFFLDRIFQENSVLVSFELASPFDVEGLKIPSRTVIGKYCPWKYKGARQNPPIGGCDWSPEDNGNRYYDKDNVATTAGNDVCGKTLAACKIRFQNGNTNVPLPFGGFPGSRKFR